MNTVFELDGGGGEQLWMDFIITFGPHSIVSCL